MDEKTLILHNFLELIPESLLTQEIGFVGQTMIQLHQKLCYCASVINLCGNKFFCQYTSIHYPVHCSSRVS